MKDLVRNPRVCTTCNGSGVVYSRIADDVWDSEDCPHCLDPLTSTVELLHLTLEEARTHPLLKGYFHGPPEHDGEYYTEIQAHGNYHHADFWPDTLIAVIVDDKVKILEAASDWHWRDVL